jgi:hypothetical protein
MTPADLVKAVGQSSTDAYEMVDITQPIIRKPSKPGLLSAILTPNPEYGNTDVFEFDNIEYTAQLPEGKSRTEVPEAKIRKDLPTKKYYAIPSFGLSYTMTPKDIDKRRKIGTSELMKAEDLIAEMEMKQQLAWELHKELAMAQLLTADTNLVSGGPGTVYNFYTDLVGGARPAATDMLLGGTQDHFVQASEQREELEEELARYGFSADRIAVICGRTYFNARLEIEKQEGIARELNNAKDLVSEIVPEISDGSFNYQMFESHDGLVYIKYTANIAGSKLIADADAYMVPLGVTENLITTAYAPAVTMSYVNTTAVPMYSWAKEDERSGITVATESNVLYANLRPKAVKHLTSSTFPS